MPGTVNSTRHSCTKNTLGLSFGAPNANITLVVSLTEVNAEKNSVDGLERKVQDF